VRIAATTPSELRPNGDIRTLAGNGKEGKADGIGAAASFNHPLRLAVDKSGNVYVADRDNHLVRLVRPVCKVSAVVGTGTAGFTEGPAFFGAVQSALWHSAEPR